MKPTPSLNSTVAFVVVGQAFGVAFALLALHLSADDVRIYWNEEWLPSELFPAFSLLILSADAFLIGRWFLVAAMVGLSLWLERKLMLGLPVLQSSRAIKVWTYSVLGALSLFAVMCLGFGRYSIW